MPNITALGEVETAERHEIDRPVVLRCKSGFIKIPHEFNQKTLDLFLEIYHHDADAASGSFELSTLSGLLTKKTRMLLNDWLCGEEQKNPSEALQKLIGFLKKTEDKPAFSCAEIISVINNLQAEGHAELIDLFQSALNKTPRNKYSQKLNLLDEDKKETWRNIPENTYQEKNEKPKIILEAKEAMASRKREKMAIYDAYQRHKHMYSVAEDGRFVLKDPIKEKELRDYVLDEWIASQISHAIFPTLTPRVDLIYGDQGSQGSTIPIGVLSHTLPSFNEIVDAEDYDQKRVDVTYELFNKDFAKWLAWAWFTCDDDPRTSNMCYDATKITVMRFDFGETKHEKSVRFPITPEIIKSPDLSGNEDAMNYVCGSDNWLNDNFKAFYDAALKAEIEKRGADTPDFVKNHTAQFEASYFQTWQMISNIDQSKFDEIKQNMLQALAADGYSDEMTKAITARIDSFIGVLQKRVTEVRVRLEDIKNQNSTDLGSSSMSTDEEEEISSINTKSAPTSPVRPKTKPRIPPASCPERFIRKALLHQPRKNGGRHGPLEYNGGPSPTSVCGPLNNKMALLWGETSDGLPSLPSNMKIDTPETK